MDDKVFDDAIIGTVEQLNLFEPVIVQSAVQRAVICEQAPNGQQPSSQSAPIHFTLPGDSRNYLDLSKTRIKVKARILNEQGGPIEKDEAVAPVNLTLQSLWSMVELSIAEKSTNFPTNGCYPYIAMMQALLKNSPHTKSGKLASQMFFSDSGEDMDGTPDMNPGFVQRAKLFAGSKQVTMEGPLVADLFSTPRYILCNTKVEISLYRSLPEFVIQGKSGKKYQMVLDSVYLKPYYLECSSGVVAGHARALKSGAKAIYPYTKVNCHSYSIAPGSTHFTFDNIFKGSLPKRVLCAFVRSDSFSGKFETNPYFFQHFDLTQIELSADGTSMPARAMTFKFDSEGRDVSTPFLRLYDCVGASNDHVFGNGLGLDDFANGHSIFAFPLAGGGIEGNHMEVKKSAAVNIQGTFGKPTPNSVTLIVYSENTCVLEMDEARKVDIY